MVSPRPDHSCANMTYIHHPKLLKQPSYIIDVCLRGSVWEGFKPRLRFSGRDTGMPYVGHMKQTPPPSQAWGKLSKDWKPEDDLKPETQKFPQKYPTSHMEDTPTALRSVERS